MLAITIIFLQVIVNSKGLVDVYSCNTNLLSHDSHPFLIPIPITALASRVHNPKLTYPITRHTNVQESLQTATVHIGRCALDQCIETIGYFYLGYPLN